MFRLVMGKQGFQFADRTHFQTTILRLAIIGSALGNDNFCKSEFSRLVYPLAEEGNGTDNARKGNFPDKYGLSKR